MRTRKILFVLPLALSLCLLGLSCQRGRGPMTTVAGRVTYNGSPLPSGTIVFVPDTSRGEQGPIAFGTIHADGTYTLKTGEAQGASAGWYKVTVNSLTSSLSQSGQPFTFPQSVIPEKYRDPDLSLLVCEVKAHQANSIDFNLK
jgi:hypothetical protein